MQLVITEGQLLGNDDLPSHEPHPFDGSLPGLSLSIVVAPTFKTLAIFQRDSITRRRLGQWARQAQLQPQRSAVPGNHHRIDGASPQELPPLTQGVGKILPSLQRRAEHAQHAQDRLGGRFHQAAERVVMNGLDLEKARQVVQQMVLRLHCSV